MNAHALAALAALAAALEAARTALESEADRVFNAIENRQASPLNQEQCNAIGDLRKALSPKGELSEMVQRANRAFGISK